MAVFSFTGSLPAYKAPLLSAQLRNRFNDIKDYLLLENALGLTFPTSVASAAQYDILLLNAGKTGFDFGKTIRTPASINFTGTPTNGDLLQFTGATTAAPVTTALPTAWSNKTSNFNVVSGGQYTVDTTGGTVTATLPSSPVYGNFVIFEPASSWASNNLILGRNGSNIDSSASNKTLSSTAYTFVIYIDSTIGWRTAILENIPINVMTGASSGSAGTSGLVPQPTAGEDDEALFGDATFKRIIPVLIDYIPTVITSNTNAVNGSAYMCDTTSATFTLTLPSSPAAGDKIYLIDYAGTFNTNKLTIGRNSSKINGLTEDMDCLIRYSSYSLVYIDSTQGWKVLRGWI